MDAKCKTSHESTAGNTTYITAVFGIDRSDTQHLFDDMKIAQAAPATTNAVKHVTPHTQHTESETAPEGATRNVKEVVVRLPMISDSRNLNSPSNSSDEGNTPSECCQTNGIL